ncbi:hypothetical protein ACFQ3K_11970 [Brucella gallinifaecis]|uniref:Uncharacterized protein n=1 Tax=Brucella gallinifaecis TaxID=215590 RepID=A0A502BNJ8_9HYPH|nr:hypothetical protein [Brucella gallinifaecis]TPF74828.1 hypothetical protein FHY56_12485 [Brucella gallinifaecis]
MRARLEPGSMSFTAQENGTVRSCASTTQKMWLDRVTRPYVALSTALSPPRQRSFFTKRLTIGRTHTTLSRDFAIQTIEVRYL